MLNNFEKYVANKELSNQLNDLVDMPDTLFSWVHNLDCENDRDIFLLFTHEVEDFMKQPNIMRGKWTSYPAPMIMEMTEYHQKHYFDKPQPYDMQIEVNGYAKITIQAFKDKPHFDKKKINESKKDE